MAINTKIGVAAGVVALTGAIAVAQMGVGNQQQLSGTVKIDGSSTVYPITEAVAEEFRNNVSDDVRITVGISGTGGGFKRFVAGETDISNASRPIKAKEYEAAKSAGIEFIEIPVAYDGLTVVVNPQNYWADTLTVDQIKKIFLAGNPAQTWADVNPAWPAEPIKIYSPGTDSGTFDYFKEVVTEDGGSIRQDMSVSEDDNVLVRGVAGDKGAVGFFGAAYYFENKDKLKALKIDGGNGPVEVTPENIESGEYAPFSRPLFIYVNKEAAKRPEVKSFVMFYLERGPELANEVGYVSLSQSIYQRATRNFLRGKTGTQFLNDKGEKVSGALPSVYN